MIATIAKQLSTIKVTGTTQRTQLQKVKIGTTMLINYQPHKYR